MIVNDGPLALVLLFLDYYIDTLQWFRCLSNLANLSHSVHNLLPGRLAGRRISPKIKVHQGMKKKVKVIFFENKEGKERYRKTTPIDLHHSRLAKNDATYPGNFKRTPSARFEKIIWQPKSKQRENGQNWSGWLTVSSLCSNYIKNQKCQHMAFVEEKWKNT